MYINNNSKLDSNTFLKFGNYKVFIDTVQMQSSYNRKIKFNMYMKNTKFVIYFSTKFNNKKIKDKFHIFSSSSIFFYREILTNVLIKNCTFKLLKVKILIFTFKISIYIFLKRSILLEHELEIIKSVPNTLDKLIYLESMRLKLRVIQVAQHR